jgi:hypothetical protein
VPLTSPVSVDEQDPAVQLDALEVADDPAV